jgi:hypothetical protein
MYPIMTAVVIFTGVSALLLLVGTVAKMLGAG